MRDAVVGDLLPLGAYRLTVADCAAASVSIPEDHRCARARPRDGESAVTFVARMADRHDLAWVVAPETGGVLLALARCVDPARWLGCEPGAIECSSSKRATLIALASAGAATPLAFAADAETARWVVKPDDGAGASKIRVHGDHAVALRDAAARAGNKHATTVEPWVDGTPMSLSLVCGPRGARIASVNRQRIEVDGAGWLAYAGVELGGPPRRGPDGEAYASLAAAVSRAMPGLRGFVGVDFVQHPRHGPVAIEVNPRTTCAYVGLSALLGRNVAAEVIAAASRKAGHG
jgi:tyramine---L-glutamate ligase